MESYIDINLYPVNFSINVVLLRNRNFISYLVHHERSGDVRHDTDDTIVVDDFVYSG